MENKVGKKANLTIIFLAMLIFSVTIYCAKTINEENIIILLSLICVATWVCIGLNFRKGNIKSSEMLRRDIKENYIEGNTLKNEDNVLQSIFREDECRVTMLKKAMEATVMLLDRENSILGTAVFINNEGNLLANGYKLNKDGNLVQFECGDRLYCKFYNSDKTIEGIVEKVFRDEEGNLFSMISISLNDYTKYLSLGDSNDLGIGNKVYAVCPFEEYRNINVVEGIVAQINQDYKIGSDNIFKSNNCILYNGIATKASLGGPLLNVRGEIIGLLLGKCEDYERLSFAISINNIKDIINNETSDSVIDEVALDKSIV